VTRCETAQTRLGLGVAEKQGRIVEVCQRSSFLHLATSSNITNDTVSRCDIAQGWYLISSGARDA
jgi:hypothetical protein